MTEREKFEHCVMEMGILNNLLLSQKTLSGEYVSETAQDYWKVWQKSRAQAQHPDDMAVDKFAADMKAKLAVSRNKGRSGWDDPTVISGGELAALLVEHVAKGDPVDVANLAMMLHLRHIAHHSLAAALNDYVCAQATQQHDWQFQGGSEIWDFYYKCSKCGKRATIGADVGSISADGCNSAHAVLQRELSMIGSAIESFDSTAAALRALIDWHCAVAVDPAVNGGKVLVPVDSLHRIMELAGAMLVYQPFGSKDRQHFDALLAATNESQS